MFDFIKKLWPKKQNNEFTLIQTFGCTEVPPNECPTFVQRAVHKQFVNALNSYNIIVVYGESRQGKTWTIEKYCTEQIRIGCNATMSVEQIKEEMLHCLGVDILSIEHSITDEVTEKGTITSEVGQKMLFGAGAQCSQANIHVETLKTTYPTVDISKNTEFIKILRDNSKNKYFVFDNFHYLQPSVQQEFCSWLKEFNYHEIKIIIVGVWKDASRITALAPDLTNRCQHIDIGTWELNELDEVLDRGEKALNVIIDQDAVSLYKKCCANNIGIFKDFLQKHCQAFGVNSTAKKRKELIDDACTQLAAKTVVDEAYTPLHDRIINLALPQRDKKESKQMRLKIIISVLRVIKNNVADVLQNGLLVSEIKSALDSLCKELGHTEIDISNMTQELGLLHMREENRQTGKNFISLFYFDKTNKKLLILDPTFYVIKEYNAEIMSALIDELLQYIKTSK